MASYELRIKKEAEKEILSLPKVDLKRVVERIRQLSEDPRPQGYRVRQGDWRVVYLVDDRSKIVRVIKVGHRKEVYR